MRLHPDLFGKLQVRWLRQVSSIGEQHHWRARDIQPDVLGLQGDQRAGVIFYVSSVTVIGLLILLLWWYATSHHRLVDKQLDPSLIRHHIEHALIGPLSFALPIDLSFLHPSLAEVGWLLIGRPYFVATMAFM